jgi:hypothetical protein
MRIKVQGQPGQIVLETLPPLSKITRKKWTGCVSSGGVPALQTTVPPTTEEGEKEEEEEIEKVKFCLEIEQVWSPPMSLGTGDTCSTQDSLSTPALC